MKFRKEDMEILRFLFKVCLDYKFRIDGEPEPFQIKDKIFRDFYDKIKSDDIGSGEVDCVDFKLTDSIALSMNIGIDYDSIDYLYIYDVEKYTIDKHSGFTTLYEELGSREKIDFKDEILKNNPKIAFHINDFKKLCEKAEW